MSVEAMTWVWNCSRATGPARFVLLAIADNANSEGSHAWPSIAELARKTAMHEDTVRRALRKLQQIGELQIEERQGTSNTYRVVMTPPQRAGGSFVDTPPLRTPPRRKQPPRREQGGPPRTERPHPPAQSDPNHPLTTNEPPEDHGAPDGARPPDKSGRPARPVSIDRQVFDFWRTERGKSGRVDFNDARKRVVTVALKAYSLEDLLDAIRGVAVDERRWPDRARNDDLLLVLRLGGRGNRNNLEYFRDLYRNRDGPHERPPLMPDPSLRIVPDEEPLPQERLPGYNRHSGDVS